MLTVDQILWVFDEKLGTVNKITMFWDYSLNASGRGLSAEEITCVFDDN